MTLDARPRSGFKAEILLLALMGYDTCSEIEDRGLDSRSFHCSPSYVCEKDKSKRVRFSPLALSCWICSPLSVSLFSV